MNDTWPRWFANRTVLWVLLLVSLAVGATPKVVGDGGEYFVYAVAMASGHVPPLSPEDLQDAKSVLVSTEAQFETWDPERSTVANASGDRDFVHFWFYPAIAAPGAFLARSAGISPAWSFVFANVVLLTLAWHLSVARFGWAVSLLVCGGPVLWWVDKVHTEVFTVSLLTIAVASLSSRPWLSLVALGAAATQNPPIAALLLPFGMAGLWITRVHRGKRATLLGLAGGTVLASLHPLYYVAAHGHPSLIATASRGVLPNLSEFGAVLWDTNLGLVFGHPLFVLAFAGSMFVLFARKPGALLDPELAAAAASVLVLLLAFSQTTNFQHGGTPGLSRYALWLFPLGLPTFNLARSHAGARAWMEPWAVLSLLVCLAAYHPTVADQAYRPSYATRRLWPTVPASVRPLPEVFSETVRGDDAGIHVPVALPGCEKVLMQGGSNQRAMWPVPCYPAQVPELCRRAGTLCYANRAPRGYTFDLVPRPAQTLVRYSSTETWDPRAEATARRLLDGADWPALKPGSASRVPPFVRSTEQVRRTWDLQSEHALVLVTRGTGPEARVLLRLPRQMEGPIVDGETGSEIGHAVFLGAPYELFELRLPETRGLLLVVLR
jgi:hypothetical protein